MIMEMTIELTCLVLGPMLCNVIQHDFNSAGVSQANPSTLGHFLCIHPNSFHAKQCAAPDLFYHISNSLPLLPQTPRPHHTTNTSSAPPTSSAYKPHTTPPTHTETQ